MYDDRHCDCCDNLYLPSSFALQETFLREQLEMMRSQQAQQAQTMGSSGSDGFGNGSISFASDAGSGVLGNSTHSVGR